VLKNKRSEFARLFQEFTNSYPSTPDGVHHVTAYEEQRREGRRNFDTVVEAADRGEVVTDLVLLKLLPYYDFAGNLQKGAWVHIAPAIRGNVTDWFQSKGWTKAEDWPCVAEAILNFVRRCNEDPRELPAACREFSQLPYSKGFQTGMLTPILNALRPDDFLIINYKSRHTINYLSGESYSLSLMDYPILNATEHELVEELAENMKETGAPEMRDADLFDMFSHWLVAVKKYFDKPWLKPLTPPNLEAELQQILNAGGGKEQNLLSSIFRRAVLLHQKSNTEGFLGAQAHDPAKFSIMVGNLWKINIYSVQWGRPIVPSSIETTHGARSVFWCPKPYSTSLVSTTL
jgi:5-methylcytosine-specific restriction protein B